MHNFKEKFNQRNCKLNYNNSFLIVKFDINLKIYSFWAKNGFIPISMSNSSYNNKLSLKLSMIYKPIIGSSIIDSLIKDYQIDFITRFFLSIDSFRDRSFSFIFISILTSLINFIKIENHKKNNLIYCHGIYHTFNYLDFIRINAFLDNSIGIYFINDIILKLSYFYFFNQNFFIL